MKVKGLYIIRKVSRVLGYLKKRIGVKYHKCCGCGNYVKTTLTTIIEQQETQLCINCSYKLCFIRQSEIDYLTQVGELMRDQKDDALGVYGMINKFMRHSHKQPQQKNINYNYGNINIHDNQIGVLNTGNIERLNYNVEVLSNNGYEDFADTLKILIEEIGNAAQVSSQIRNEILEMLKFLSEQATKNKTKRDSFIGKMVLASLPTLLQQIPRAGDYWDRLKPLFEKLF